MRILFAAATFLLGILPMAGSAQAAPKASDLVQAELVAEPRGIEPGRPFTVGIRLRMAEHWHTYWRNPGDSGLATEIAWTLPPGFSAGPIQWPAPNRQPIGPLVNYGFEDEATLLVEITPPASLAVGRKVELKALVNYLVCERECIPGEANLAATVPAVAAGQGGGDPASGYIFDSARAALPTAFGGRSAVSQEDGKLLLRLDDADLAKADIASVYFFPASETAIEHAAEQGWAKDENGLTLRLKRSPVASGPAPSELAGVLTVEVRNGGEGIVRRNLQIGTIAAPTAGSGAAAAATPRGVDVDFSISGFAWAALFALLGGLVLNLMPCVFPVLSIKVMHLVEHSGQSRAAIRMAGLSYAAGVVASFLAVAGALLALRAGGQEVGWGFQLQSPVLVAGLAFLLFAVGLSLSGVAEFGSSLAGRAGSVETGSGAGGAFLTGILAALVATPCTAPFMGAAIGYAVSAPVGIALAVFGALGLGLAAPFLALTFWPSLLALLPRPGAWMDTFKQLLAFPIYATVAWLLFVLAQQVGSNTLFLVLLGLVLLAFAMWSWRLSVRQGGLSRRLAQAVAVVAVAGVVGIGWTVGQDRSGGSVASGQAAGGQEKFTQARLDQLRGEGRAVFVNMTAAWCITCLVNERAVLSSDTVRTALQDRGVIYLKGDWTNQNPEITRLLERHGRNGVPLYALYPAGGEPVVLPQILTQATVLDALEQIPATDIQGREKRADATIR